MPIYVVAPKSGMVRVAYESSPKVILATDAESPDLIPATVRSAADEILHRNLAALRDGKVPEGADGVILWGKGDRLISGTAADIRRDLFTPGRRALVPVHFPCMPEMELDLIALQPRWWSAGPAKSRTTGRSRSCTGISPKSATGRPSWASPTVSKRIRESAKTTASCWKRWMTSAIRI